MNKKAWGKLSKTSISVMMRKVFQGAVLVLSLIICGTKVTCEMLNEINV